MVLECSMLKRCTAGLAGKWPALYPERRQRGRPLTSSLPSSNTTHIYCQISVVTLIIILLLLIDRCPEGIHLLFLIIWHGINRQQGSQCFKDNTDDILICYRWPFPLKLIKSVIGTRKPWLDQHSCTPAFSSPLRQCLHVGWLPWFFHFFPFLFFCHGSPCSNKNVYSFSTCKTDKSKPFAFFWRTSE